VAWQGLSYVVGRLLVLVATIILARILTPEDFGLVSFALVFVTYADVITDLGVAQGLVFFPPSRSRNDAALALCVLSSGLLTIVALAAAPLVASFFGRPDVIPLFRVLSLSLFVGTLGQVPDALLRRELQFRRRLVADLARAGAQGIVSVGLALAGAGPWAIVLGYLGGAFAWTVAAWLLVSYRPDSWFWRVKPADLRPLLLYGLPTAGNALLLSLVFNVDYLIVGRILGATALGYYTLAFRLPQYAILNVFVVISKVAFPIFSRANEDRARLRSGYLTSLRLQTVYGIGAGVALAVTAPTVVQVLFGARWEPATIPLQALSLYAAFRSLGMGAVDLFKAVGRPGLAVWLSFTRLSVVLVALLVAVRFGIDAVAWTQAAVALALAIVMQVAAARVLEMPLKQLWNASAPGMAVGAATALGAGLVALWLPGPDLVRLAGSLLLAGLLAAGALRLVDPSLIREMWGLTKGRVAGNAATSART
jgi:PST family polysaccharide transporter